VKLINLINAYIAIDQMKYAEYYDGQKFVKTERELPFDQAYAIVSVSSLIKPYYDNYIKSEDELIKNYAKKDSDGNPVINNGIISFESVEDKQAYDNNIKALRETEVEISGLPIKMPKPNIVRCSWLENLDGVVEFV
jgi:hypothetical protein